MHTKYRSCLRGFLRARLGVAVRRRLAVGHVQEQDVVSLLGVAGGRAAHAEFLIIRVGPDHEDVHGEITFMSVLAKSSIQVSRSPASWARPVVRANSISIV